MSLRAQKTKVTLPSRDANYEIFTDGSSRKSRIGGWGFAIYCDGVEFLHDYGGSGATTNIEMELYAVVRALEVLKRGSTKFTVYSDSLYVVKGITELIDVWMRANWRGTGNKPVSHRELWERLGHLDCDFSPAWKWVKGHSGIIGNERADKLADQGVKEWIANNSGKGNRVQTRCSELQAYTSRQLTTRETHAA